MLEENIARVLAQIGPTDRVLDIGGWARPFNRANYVLDIGSYETRGVFGSQGPEEEFFSKETWIARDLCDRNPYPFSDKYFDYVICSHTLEDIRDPIFVCSEINRIGKRGYIEVPSLESELTLGIEHRSYAGRYHHRWLVDIKQNDIIFTFKYHIIHFHWKYHLPNRHKSNLTPHRLVQYLFWEKSFSYSESVLFEGSDVSTYLMTCVEKHGKYSRWQYAFDNLKQQINRFFRVM